MIRCPACPANPPLDRRDLHTARDGLSGTVEGFCPSCFRIWRLEARLVEVAGPVEVHADFLPHDDLLTMAADR